MIGAYDSIMKADAGPELRNLRALRAVAEEGSFAGAAAVLGCSQPAVSQQIAQLETHLDVPVLHRRPLRPTDAGRVLLAAGNEVVTVLAAAQAEIAAISEGEAGEVRVGAFDSACARLLPTALRDFRQTFPGGQVVLVECETAEAHSLLLSGELDIAVTFDYNRFPVSVPRGVTRSPAVDDPVQVAVPQSHRFAGKVIDLAELAAEQWIETPVTASQLDVLAEITGLPGFRAKMTFRGDDFQTVINLVAAGLGIALLPSLVLSDLPRGVARCGLRHVPLLRRIYVERPNSKQVTRAVAGLEVSLRRVLLDRGKHSISI